MCSYSLLLCPAPTVCLQVAEARAANAREDFSDLVAAKAAQQKRKMAQKAEDKAAKKAKDFKF